MTDGRREFVAALVAHASNGQLVGRIRLQKIAYLLKQLGAKVPAQFGYYHYGPYARELEIATHDAVEAALIREETRYRKSDGAPYSVFVSEQALSSAEADPLAAHASLVKELSRQDPIVLELAATAHWLSEVEKVDDWEQEICRRKTWKVEDGRLEQALALLKELGLPPAVKGAGQDAVAH